jgi:hypothetical protein
MATDDQQRVAELLDRLRPVDLSGGATTIGDSSRVAAAAGGFGGSEPLLKAWKRYQERQAEQRADADRLAGMRADLDRLRKAAAEAPAAVRSDVEADAVRRSAKKVRSRLGRGDTARAALAAGFKHYRKHGGTGVYTFWHRKLTGR